MKTAAGLNFGDKSIRRGFIRKVYSILSIQLLVTGAMIAFFVFLLPKYYNDPMCHQVSIKCVNQYYWEKIMEQFSRARRTFTGFSIKMTTMVMMLSILIPRRQQRLTLTNATKGEDSMPTQNHSLYLNFNLMP